MALRYVTRLAVYTTLASAFATTAHAQRDTLHYRFRWIPRAGAQPALEVALSFRGDTSGRTRIAFPTSWGGQDSLWRAIDGFTVESRARVIADSAAAGVRVLQHAPGAPIRVRYTLRQDWTGPIAHPNTNRAIVDSTRLVINAQNALALPDRPERDSIAVRVTWDALPRAWSVVTSFGTGREQRARTTYHDFAEAAFVAARMRMLPGSSSLVMSVGGAWPFADSAFAQTVARVWSAEQRFWGADSLRRAFVVLLPDAARQSVGGNAFTGGFVGMADTTTSLPQLASMFAHELFHQWNGSRLHTAAPEERYKWLTEGFTDYYADRLAHDAGAIGDSAYVARVNGVLRAYHTSPARGSTRARVEKEYWSDRDVNRFPYQQGYLIALGMPREMTDTIIRSLYRASMSRNTALTDSLIVAESPSHARERMRTAIAAYVDAGQDVPAIPTALGACYTLAADSLPRFELGFDAERTARERIVRGVVVGGPAEAAGVRDGMPIAGGSWRRGEPDSRVTLRVKQDAGTREISYFPRSSESIVVPRYAARPCDRP